MRDWTVRAMARQRKKASQGGFSVGLLCAASALLLGVPSAGLALGAIGNDAITSGFGTFTPASVNPGLQNSWAEAWMAI